jgi:dihydrofolate reductase
LAPLSLHDAPPISINQVLAAGLIDELRVHVTPAVLGAGERLFEGVPPQRFEQVASRGTSLVTHITYRPLHTRPDDGDQSRA